MSDKTGIGYTIPHEEPGWVDALCTCDDPASHPGLFCPSRSAEFAVTNPETQQDAPATSE